MIRWNVLTWVKNAIGAIHYCPSERVHAQWANKLLLGLLPSRPHSSSNVVRLASFPPFLSARWFSKQKITALFADLHGERSTVGLHWTWHNIRASPSCFCLTVCCKLFQFAFKMSWRMLVWCLHLRLWCRVSLQSLPISIMLQSLEKLDFWVIFQLCEWRKNWVLYAKMEVKMKDVFEWKTSSTLSYSKQANRQRLLSNPKKKEKEGKTFICFKPSSWGITKASPLLFLTLSLLHWKFFIKCKERRSNFCFLGFLYYSWLIPKTHRAGE